MAAKKKAAETVKIPEKFKTKGEFTWNKKKTTLSCNGKPIAKIESVQDDLFGDTRFKVNFLGKVVSGGRYGFSDKTKALATVVKYFNLK